MPTFFKLYFSMCAVTMLLFILALITDNDVLGYIGWSLNAIIVVSLFYKGWKDRS